MAVINIVQGHERIAALLLAGIAICIICLAIQVSTHDEHLPALLLCATHIVLSWCLFTIGSPHLWSLMWTFAYPHAFLLWLGLVEGTAMSIFFIASMGVLSLPPVQRALPVSHAAEHLAIYIVVLVGAFVFAFASEFLRDRVQKKLTLLTQQVAKMAFTDPLTGLGNRLAFEQHLKREYARFLRFTGAFCIIIGDIDRFKEINDSKGHAVGDAVLQHTAELLRNRVRAQDGVFRWGGEEFVITLTGLSAKEMAAVAEELRTSVATTPCPYQGQAIFYTMSLGAHYCNRAETEEAAMAKADELLYAAKRAGRNRSMADDA